MKENSQEKWKVETKKERQREKEKERKRKKEKRYFLSFLCLRPAFASKNSIGIVSFQFRSRCKTAQSLFSASISVEQTTTTTTAARTTTTARYFFKCHRIDDDNIRPTFSQFLRDVKSSKQSNEKGLKLFSPNLQQLEKVFFIFSFFIPERVGSGNFFVPW